MATEKMMNGSKTTAELFSNNLLNFRATTGASILFLFNDYLNNCVIKEDTNALEAFQKLYPDYDFNLLAAKAIAYKKLKVCAWLVQIKVKDRDDCSAFITDQLIQFAKNGRLDRLAEAKEYLPVAFFSRQDSKGFSPLLAAAANGQIKVIRWLIDNADMDTDTQRDGQDYMGLLASHLIYNAEKADDLLKLINESLPALTPVFAQLIRIISDMLKTNAQFKLSKVDICRYLTNKKSIICFIEIIRIHNPFSVSSSLLSSSIFQKAPAPKLQIEEFFKYKRANITDFYANLFHQANNTSIPSPTPSLAPTWF